MAQSNVKTATPHVPVFNHEGAPGFAGTALSQLKRSALACLLFESTFYEDGTSIAERIKELCAKVNPLDLAKLAIACRHDYKIRHASLLLARELVRHPNRQVLLPDFSIAKVIEQVVARADELSEFLAIYWSENKDAPIAHQVKKGLAAAFRNFSEYDLAKYNRDKDIKLRDVAFLVHPKPMDRAQATTFGKLMNKGKYPKKYHHNGPVGLCVPLESPDTWEVALSAGKDKKATFTRLIQEGKLGALALIRNLRKMQEVGVDLNIIRQAVNDMKVDRVLPYRFIAAARYAPSLEPELEQAMYRCIQGLPQLPGSTALLIDVSPSMDDKLSAKSEMTRAEAACGLAVLARQVCQNVRIFAFSTECKEVPPRRGFALRDAIAKAVMHNGTLLGKAIHEVAAHGEYDRLIAFTDEQSQDAVTKPHRIRQNYMVNVAAVENGVGYGDWTRISGFSEATLDFVREYER